MEKINLIEEDFSAKEIAVECMNKINEIIDWVNEVDAVRLANAFGNHLEGKDRLQTLEDKIDSIVSAIKCLKNDNEFNNKRIEFIIKNSKAPTQYDDYNTVSLQDLWDEENDKLIAEKLDNSFEGKYTVEPIVKECDCNGEPCQCKPYEPTVKDAKKTLDKINESIKKQMGEYYPEEAKMGEPTVKEPLCPHGYPYNCPACIKDIEIEEIIEEFHKEYYVLDRPKFESWLRDKLNSLK
ncbi:hypothetical protein M0R04_10835 [Candidatus Dojkabacteria bacterium]|jgi:hypothetical protein|nr:hypothetical protein [Candidatus Dojkabacteria bacterium]